MDDLRTEALKTFESLHLPPRLSLELLIGYVESVRARPMKIIETTKLSGKKICGLWIPRDDVDVVYHSLTRGRLHRQQMILHEISHMLLRHDKVRETAWQGINVFREISGQTVEKALARSDFRGDLEIMAEHLADLLASAIRDGSRQEISGFGTVFE